MNFVAEPFPDWLEEKIDLPIFEELPVGVIGVGNGTDATSLGLKHHQQPHSYPQLHHHHQQQHLHQQAHIQQQQHQHFVPAPAPVEQHTPVLLPEFDYVLNNNEIVTSLSERPQQRDEDMVLTMLQEMQPHELDELIRMRVESLVEPPDSCVESSRSSSQEESESAASPSSDSGYDDPDWTPEPLTEFTTPKRRRTTKPYSRTAPEEKRQRKKEQNKNAATRYRLKKKAEIEEILAEEKGLISKNEKLKTDLSELAREIKYLKSLMRDVFKAKGLLK